MKLCVFSDSHGNAGNMIAAIERERPALCFFLGDGERDLDTVRERFPALPFYAVRGNCDGRSKLSASLVCAVGGVRIFACHGHRYDVKYESVPESLLSAAKEAGADAALFGHTHRAYLARRDGVTLLNPGSIGRGEKPCYGVLLPEGGVLRAELKTL